MITYIFFAIRKVCLIEKTKYNAYYNENNYCCDYCFNCVLLDK